MAMASAKVSSKRMKAYEGSAADMKADAKHGAPEGSAKDMKQDKAGAAKMKMKGKTCPTCGGPMD